MDREANATDTAVQDRPVRGARRQVAVRRRRSRKSVRRDRWIVARSRNRTFRTAAVCAGVLLLMALGLYFGLSHQDSPPGGEGAAGALIVGPHGIV